LLWLMVFTIRSSNGMDWKELQTCDWPFDPPCFQFKEQLELPDSLNAIPPNEVPEGASPTSIRWVLQLLTEWVERADWPEEVIHPYERPSDPEVWSRVKTGLFQLFGHLERLQLLDKSKLEIHADGRGRHRRFLFVRPGELYGFGEPIEQLVKRLASINSLRNAEELFGKVPRSNTYRFSITPGGNRSKRQT
jgi:hypothetical protein